MSSGRNDLPELAIACQGGGAHTAFTAGALAYLYLCFEWFERTKRRGPAFRLVGLSGTSGGAITAAMAWSAVPGGSWAEGANRVLRFWNRNKASLDPAGKDPLWWNEYYVNAAMQFGLLWRDYLPRISAPPNADLARLAQGRMKDDMRFAIGAPPDAERFAGRPGVQLFAGVVDVFGGDLPQDAFRTFPARPAEGVLLDELLASACIPEIFPAQALTNPDDGRTRYYWDGLYSQNPPIHEFFKGRRREDKPDLIWLIQINPSRYEGEGAPDTLRDIDDRRNELSGNLSLGQELRSIDRMNQVADEVERLAARLDDAESLAELRAYKKVTVARITLEKQACGERPLSRYAMDYKSKLDRSPGFIDALMAEGIARAHQAAVTGALVQPDRCQRTVCARRYDNPDWPPPAALAPLLSDELREQWCRLVAAI
jgi:NTE family protein